MIAVIWSTPTVCSCDAAVISCTRSAVLRVAGTISSKALAGAFGQAHAVAGQLTDFLRRDLATLG